MRHRRGFTLLELMASLAVIAILASIFVPYALSLRESARRTQCANNLMVIRDALLAYARDNNSMFPRVRWDKQGNPNSYTAYTGADDPDPFAEESAVAPNDVTASLWLLMRQGLITDLAVFICPSAGGVPEQITGDPRSRGNFRSRAGLTYSYSSPFSNADWYRMNDTQPADFALMADMNPGIAGDGDDVTGVRHDDKPRRLMRGNSNNHAKVGQNVLYASGHVQFQTTPYCGNKRDNIYTVLARRPHWSLGVPPAAPGYFGRDVGASWMGDSYLVPSDDE